MVGGKNYDWKNEDWLISSILVYFDVFMILIRLCKLLSRQIFGSN